MFAKIVKGKDLATLEKSVNDYLTDCENVVDQKRLKIYNVQQFVVGEVDPGNVSLLNRAPVPTYSFCLLLICGYE
jgi:hypothetical protein